MLAFSSFNPSHYQFNEKLYLLICKFLSLLYPMPFLNTSPTTGGGGMLGNENKVPSHRSLFAIIFRMLRSYSGFYEIKGVPPDCIDTFILDILPVNSGQFKFRSEL